MNPLLPKAEMKPDPKDLRRASRIFKALSHPFRLRIACELAHGGPATQKQLIEKIGCPQSTMARHLAILRDMGLIKGMRKGTEVVLDLSGPVPARLMSSVCSWVHPETGERFSSRYHALMGE